MWYVVVTLGDTWTPGEVLLAAPAVLKSGLVQEVAYVDDQVSVDDCPPEMDDGEAVRRTVGAGCTTVLVKVVHPELSPCELIVSASKVTVPVFEKECVVCPSVPLGTVGV